MESPTDVVPTPTDVVPTPTIAVPTVTPSPTVRPSQQAGTLRAASVAVTTTDRLRVRSQPRIADDSVPYKPLLPLGSKLLILEGPVTDTGYAWYRVAPISLALSGGVTDGWVAAADKDGTPWIAPTAGAPYADLRTNIRLQNRPTTKTIRISGDHADLSLYLVTRSLDPSACVIAHSTQPDKPGVSATLEQLEPSAMQVVPLIDGSHDIVASCPSSAGAVDARYSALVIDGQPELCSGYSFPAGAISITTLEELSSGIVGTWEGCVTTPWLPMYWITMTFRADGTYSAKSDEVLDGQQMVAMYYGVDEDAPAKRYAIKTLQSNGTGVGEINVAFSADQIAAPLEGDLRNIRLMGEQLEFEFFHRGEFGPLTFQLRRAAS